MTGRDRQVRRVPLRATAWEQDPGLVGADWSGLERGLEPVRQEGVASTVPAAGRGRVRVRGSRGGRRGGAGVGWQERACARPGSLGGGSCL